MPGKAKKNNKAYRSMAEFRKEFLPNEFQIKIKEEQEKKPGSFGSELATEFLENIKRKLSK